MRVDALRQKRYGSVAERDRCFHTDLRFMPTVPLNDAEIYYRSVGPGRESIFFSHGLLLDHHQWDHQIDHFSERFRCVAYDHRGQGDSNVADAPLVDMETLYFDAAALVEHFDAAPCHFVGASMGGNVGLRLAARRPELVDSLVVVGTRPGPEPHDNVPRYRRMNFVARWIGMGLVLERVMPHLFGDHFLKSPEAEPRRERWKSRLQSRNPSISKAVEGVLFRPGIESELEKIDVPMLIIHGEDDRSVPIEVGRRLAERMPNAEFVAIPDAGHTPPVENPTAVNEALAEFFDDVAGD